jgi:hypothetical protein
MIKEFIKTRSFLIEKRTVKALPTNVGLNIDWEIDDY